MKQMDKSNKLEQERIANDRDNVMRKQHAIMQAQRRQLQGKNITEFNMGQDAEKKYAKTHARQVERDEANGYQVGDLSQVLLNKAI